MEVRAIHKDVRIAPQKVALVASAVRGKPVSEALAMLRFMRTPAARAVAKAVKSAAASAENNFQMLAADLRVARVSANEGHVAKRFRPQARGRIAPILRRSCHIDVVVAGEET
ncbi:MAG: 50S ribosomal protein L22 [Chloroflexi bacterium]|nr:50S ribosomal protein L22 [Chloroflexota bacterium]